MTMKKSLHSMACIVFIVALLSGFEKSNKTSMDSATWTDSVGSTIDECTTYEELSDELSKLIEQSWFIRIRRYRLLFLTPARFV